MNALRSMATALGGDVVNGRNGSFILCPGPGHTPKDRSLSVAPSATDPDGFVCFSHANDAWQDCRRYILNRLGRPVERAKFDRSIAHVDIWETAVDPRNTLVERYLTGRGLELFDDLVGRVIRFHPRCPFGPGVRHPCMITAFRSIMDDKLQAIHRTALTPDAKKIDRKMLGPVAGAAIKVDADENVEYGLTIGEGFETCLAARQLGFRPVWALGSATAISTFPVLSGVDVLTILAETDDSGANAKAIRACGNRWRFSDREVIIATPRIGGDINGALQS